MLDKNPQPNTNFEKISKLMKNNELNSIMCNEPFTKTVFLLKLIENLKRPIFYLDFDLLFTGYTNSGIYPLEEKISLFQPSKKEFGKTLKVVLDRISKNQCTVIVDSFNGLSNLFEGKDSARKINAIVMLLVCAARANASNVIVTSMAKHREGEGWILTPTGRHLINIELMNKILLKQNDSGISANHLNKENSIIESIKI